MNKTKTWKFLADRKRAEFNELDRERRVLVNAKMSIDEKIIYVEQIIEEQQAEVNGKDSIFRMDAMHKTRQVYLSQLNKVQQGLVTQSIDVDLKLSRIQHQMQTLQIDKKRYEKLADLSNKKLEKYQTQLDQKDSDQFAIQNFIQKNKAV